LFIYIIKLPKIGNSLQKTEKHYAVGVRLERLDSSNFQFNAFVYFVCLFKVLSFTYFAPTRPEINKKLEFQIYLKIIEYLEILGTNANIFTYFW